MSQERGSEGSTWSALAGSDGGEAKPVDEPAGVVQISIDEGLDVVSSCR